MDYNYQLTNCLLIIAERVWNEGDTPMREMGNWREYQIRRLANDREAAIDYLQLTLEEYLVDSDLSFFLKELRVFIASQGEVSELSKRTGIDIETLLNMLSNEDAPRLDTFQTLLNALKRCLKNKGYPNCNWHCDWLNHRIKDFEAPLIKTRGR